MNSGSNLEYTKNCIFDVGCESCCYAGLSFFFKWLCIDSSCYIPCSNYWDPLLSSDQVAQIFTEISSLIFLYIVMILKTCLLWCSNKDVYIGSRFNFTHSMLRASEIACLINMCYVFSVLRYCFQFVIFNIWKRCCFKISIVEL